MKTKKKILITVFSIISILFGLCGAIFSFGGILVLDSYRQDFENIHNLSLSVAESIDEVAEALKNSDDTSEHIAESIRTTRSTLGYASEISYDSGLAFNEVAGIVGFEILGLRPLESAEEYFSSIGDNLVILSEELSVALENLETNASDIERTGRELVNISEELEKVSVLFNETIDSFDIYNLVSIVKYLLIYMGMLSIIFILNGTMFLMLGR